MDFFRDFKKNLEEDVTFSKLAENVTEFIGELAERFVKGGNEIDIVTKISIENKLTLISENKIDRVRTDILKDFANSTKDGEDLYFIFNKVKGKDSYRVWEINEGGINQIEMNKSDLPIDATVNDVMRKENNKFIVDESATKSVESSIRRSASEIVREQDRKIEDYKKEGHTYLVTEDTNGRIFLWDSTEKPKYEIEDVNFPEELKYKAKEGNSFVYRNGKYEYIE